MSPGPTSPGDHGRTLGVVGLGLIGGSVALDAADLGWRVVSTDTDPLQRQRAATAGLTVVEDLARLVAADVELVVVATPAARVAAVLADLDDLVDRPLLASAVASVQEPDALGLGDCSLRHVRHLGGHPMTGTERSGFPAARRGMFDGAPWIVTATATDLVGDLRAVVDLALGLRAAPVVVPPDEHDRTVALLSHLPHVLAYALYGRLAVTGDHGVELLAGGSFRDATRVAATRPDFWAGVLGLNRSAVADLVAEVRRDLGDVERLLRSSSPTADDQEATGDVEGLERWLRRGHREVGRSRPSVSGPTALPPDDEPIGAAAFERLRGHVRAGLAIAGWSEQGAVQWTPL